MKRLSAKEYIVFKEIHNPFMYYTFWSNIISFSFLFWALFFKIKTWIFLFAICLVTSTSIIGTFFLTLPRIDNLSEHYSIDEHHVLLADSLIHTLPIFIILILFNFYKKRLIGKPNLMKTIYILTVFCLLYQLLNNFVSVYYYDTPIIVLLFSCVFLSSYYIYNGLISN